MPVGYFLWKSLLRSIVDLVKEGNLEYFRYLKKSIAPRLRFLGLLGASDVSQRGNFKMRLNLVKLLAKSFLHILFDQQ